MMHIEDHVRAVIYNYPTLYRVIGNPALSRMKVLTSLFCTIGTGYEWCRETGTLTYEKTKPRWRLPEGFFDKQLYDIELSAHHKKLAVELLSGRFHYRRQDRLNISVIVEATLEEAKQLQSQLAPRTPDGDLLRLSGYVHAASTEAVLYFYPMCEYSAIVEMIEGKTNSLHVENYSFDTYPVREDWVAACGEVALAGLEYYNDESRYSEDYYHPSRRSEIVMDDFQSHRLAQIQIFKRFIDKFKIC